MVQKNLPSRTIRAFSLLRLQGKPERSTNVKTSVVSEQTLEKMKARGRAAYGYTGESRTVSICVC